MVGGLNPVILTIAELQVTGELDGSRIVQPILPAGAGFPAGPTARAVRVIVCPRAGIPLDDNVTTGVNVETFNVTELETAAT